MRRRNGFTLLEVLVVLIIVGVIGGLAMVNVSRSLQSSNVHRAATVMSADLREAFSLAARQRRPVEIVVDPGTRTIGIRDATTPTTIYATRSYGTGSEQPVQSMTTTKTTVRVYPTGLAADSMSITVRWGDRTRTVNMNRAGLVRMSGT